jgi:hypothetical protein
MLLHQTHGALSDLRGKLVRLVHGSIFSKVRASSKSGAVQTRQYVAKFNVRYHLALVRLSAFRVAKLRYTFALNLSLLSIDAYIAVATRCVVNLRAFWNREMKYESSGSAIEKLDDHVLDRRLRFLK